MKYERVNKYFIKKIVDPKQRSEYNWISKESRNTLNVEKIIWKRLIKKPINKKFLA